MTTDVERRPLRLFIFRNDKKLQQDLFKNWEILNVVGAKLEFH